MNLKVALKTALELINKYENYCDVLSDYPEDRKVIEELTAASMQFTPMNITTEHVTTLN